MIDDKLCTELILLIANKSDCLRRKVGALLRKDGRVLTIAYNRMPDCYNPCDKCARDNYESGSRLDLCLAVHAEEQLIINCALNKVSPEGSDLFVTCLPCHLCAKKIINAKIKNIYYIEKYNDSISEQMFDKAGINLYKINI